MYKHFIWDFDGTLFNSYPSTIDIFRNELRKYNIDESYDDIMKEFLVSAGHAIDFYISKYNLPASFGSDFDNAEKKMPLSLIKPYQYAVEVLAQVKKQGGHNYLLTHRGDSADKIIKMNNMQDYFTELVTHENGFKRKPDPEAVNYLLDKYNIKKEEVLIVGDRELEILLGKNSGVKVCFFNSGNLKTELQADYEIHDLCNFIDAIIY